MSLARKLILSVFALSLAFSFADDAEAQPSVYFRVEVSIGGGEPTVEVQPFEGRMSLAERAALQAMWDTLASHMTTVARQCAMPVIIEIDAESFRGNMVAGTEDGLHPGARGRFTSLVRALSAVCGRGSMEQGAVQSSVRTVRFGFTTSAADEIALTRGTLLYRTNGDLTGQGHMDYSPFIDWIMARL
jgi:hypothetical protein